jgi:hypothetical protein
VDDTVKVSTQCTACGATDVELDRVRTALWQDERLVVVEGVPALPADGQALAENTCQSCHSIFTSYLTQSRDVQGWRSIFLSPFHRELKLAEREREEFARYSAINMPMKVDDVPSDIRF